MKTPLTLFTVATVLIGFAACSREHRPKAEVSPEARAILERWGEAEGGEQALRDSLCYELKSSWDFGNGSPKMESCEWHAADGRSRNELEGADGQKYVMAFDGQIGWLMGTKLGFGLRSSIDVEQTKANGDLLEPYNVARSHQSCAVAPDETRDGRLCHCLKLTGLDGIEERWYFDVKTGLRVRIERAPWPAHPQGGITELIEYKRFGKVSLPSVVRNTQGSQTIEMTVTSMKLNPLLDDKMFQASPTQLHEAKKVDEVLARYQKAIGGRDAFMRLDTRVTHATSESLGLKDQLVISQKHPSKVLIEADVVGMGRITQSYDGTEAWISGEVLPGQPIKSANLERLLSSAEVRNDMALADRYPLRKWVGEPVVDGRKTEAIALATWGRVAGVYYFDPATGRLVRIDVANASGSKNIPMATIEYSDFRTIDGITMPFVTTTISPSTYTVYTVTSVEQNMPLDDAIFKPRKD